MTCDKIPNYEIQNFPFAWKPREEKKENEFLE